MVRLQRDHRQRKAPQRGSKLKRGEESDT